MIALAVFGAGLGMFIAPNNSSTLGAAPGDRASEAGGLLNFMRVFRTSVGVACASAVLSWRLATPTGTGDHTGCVETGLARGSDRRVVAADRFCRRCRCHVDCAGAAGRRRGRQTRLKAEPDGTATADRGRPRSRADRLLERRDRSELGGVGGAHRSGSRAALDAGARSSSSKARRACARYRPRLWRDRPGIGRTRRTTGARPRDRRVRADVGPCSGTHRVPRLANADIVVADATTYGFSPGDRDLLFSRLGVMFFADPAAALTNLRRATRTGGRIEWIVWRALAEVPWFAVPLASGAPAAATAPSSTPWPPGRCFRRRRSCAAPAASRRMAQFKGCAS